MFDKPMDHLLFQTLSHASKEVLKKHINKIRYNKNDCLICEDEANDKLFILLEGTLNVECNTGELVAVLKEGSVIGEISSTGISLPIADVIAQDAVTVLAFPMNVIHEIAEAEEPFTKALYDLGMGRVMSRLLDL